MPEIFGPILAESKISLRKPFVVDLMGALAFVDIGHLPECDPKALIPQLTNHFRRIRETRGGELVVTHPVFFVPVGIKMDDITRDTFGAQMCCEAFHLFAALVADLADPKTKACLLYTSDA